MTTATLRPNLHLDGPLNVTGAATVEDAVSDDSDASYVTTVNTALITLDLETVAMGAGSITKRMRLRARGRGDTVATEPIIALRDENEAVIFESFPLPFSTSLADFNLGYQSVDLDQATVDRLIYSIQPESTLARFYELYVDLVYVTIPVVAVDAVTDPYTDSTYVPITWVNTLDSDGGAQTRYEVKVYNAAQYGAGGFDPDTSTPYWTSGEVIAATTNATTGSLVDGTTYRAYVRVAQTVNGASHWSDWDYDEFTVDVATADVDTVTAAADNDGGFLTVTVERDTLSEDWELIEVERSVDGGATWSAVRGATLVNATADPDTFTIVDYEVANGQAVIHRARASRTVAALRITGDWVESSSTSWSSTDVWLKAPKNPSANLTVKLRVVPDETYDVRQGVFRVLGSSTPVVVTNTRQAASGTLLVKVDTLADVAAMRTLIAEPILLVHAPADYDLGFDYIAPGRITRQRVPRPVVRPEWWQLEYVEVDAPADPDAGS